MANKRVKVSDLKEIEDRYAPALIYVERYAPRGSTHPDPIPTLHISDRTGRPFGQSWKRSITRCNRVLEHPCHFGSTWRKGDPFAEFKLCTRCGNRQDFEQAEEQRCQYEAALKQVREARRHGEERQREQAAQERHAHFKELMQSLAHSGFAVEPIGDTYFYALRLTLTDGSVYEIEEAAK